MAKLFLACAYAISLFGQSIGQKVDVCVCQNGTIPVDLLPQGARRDYGRACQAHDARGCYARYGPNSPHDLWDVSAVGGANDWCCQNWCYVSADCPLAETSVLGVDFKYSYDVCAPSGKVYNVMEDVCGIGHRLENNNLVAAGKIGSIGDAHAEVSITDASELNANTSHPYEPYFARGSSQDRRLSAQPRRGKGGVGGSAWGSRTVTRTSWRTPAMIGGAALFVPLIIMSDRRRRMYWGSSPTDQCKMNTEYVPADGTTETPSGIFPGQDASTGSPQLDQLCNAKLGGVAMCTQCNECSTPECVSALAGCQEFLSSLYNSCQQTVSEEIPNEEPFYSVVFNALWNLAIFAIFGYVAYKCYSNAKDNAAQQNMQTGGGGYVDPNTGMQMVTQPVPPGMNPGDTFQFPHQGRMVSVTDPPGVMPGQFVQVGVPGGGQYPGPGGGQYPGRLQNHAPGAEQQPFLPPR